MNLARLWKPQGHLIRTPISPIIAVVGSTLLSHEGSTSCVPLRRQDEIFRRWKADDRKELAASMPKKDMGTQGETGTDIGLIGRSKDDMFPTAETPDTLFDGVRFADLPICHIKTSPNNTIITVTNYNGSERLGYRSCGIEGFKNTRKGTNIAAQATAITLGNDLVKKSVKTLRVKIQGLGPGRMSSVKGLQMAGLNIVSVTDNTPISSNPPRGKKQRRI